MLAEAAMYGLSLKPFKSGTTNSSNFFGIHHELGLTRVPSLFGRTLALVIILVAAFDRQGLAFARRFAQKLGHGAVLWKEARLLPWQ